MYQCIKCSCVLVLLAIMILNIIYTKQYPNLSQLEKAYCDFIDFWQLKYPEPKHTLQVDLGSDINIDEIYQMKCLLDAAISCSLCLPENGKGYHLQMICHT